MELLKNNRWVVLLVGVILIFICAATVWASNGVRPSYAEAASAGMGACELTDVVFDDVLHPEFIARTAAWTQTEGEKSASLANKLSSETSSDAKAKQERADKQAAKKKAEQKLANQKLAAKKLAEQKSAEKKAAQIAAAQTVSSQKSETAALSSNKTRSAASSNDSESTKSDKQTAVSTTVSAHKSAAAAQADLKSDSSVQSAKAVPAAAEAAAASQTPPTQLLFSKTALLHPDQASEATWTYAVSDEELLLLQRIVMAEAEGEPYAGKVAVANVVLNRLRSANYPDTIRDVIYQRYQFSPVLNGRFDRVVPSEDSVKAAAEALNGRKEVPDDTYFFVSLELATDMTVPNTRTPVKKIGHHTFFK